MSAGFLGPCSGCASCADGGGVGVPCDAFAFLYGAGRQAIGADSYFPVSEGASQTYTVARLPHCFSYLGSPSDYESATGSPPPVGEGGYYYDLTGSGQFYKNTGGVFGTSAPMPGYGRGEVTVRWTVQRTECGCPHMIPADTGTLTWSDGDVSDKTFSVAVTCPGPPTYWGCSESLAGGEVGNVVLSIVSLSEGACAVAGLAANLTAVCTHEAPHPRWGAYPFFVRKWGGVDKPSAGFQGFVAGTTRYLRREIIVPTAPTTSGYRELAELGDVEMEAANGGGLDYDYAAAYPGGVVDDAHFYKDFGGGETVEIILTNPSGPYPAVAAPDGNATMAAALAPDGALPGYLGQILSPSGVYGWNEAQPASFTWKLLGNQAGFSDPAFDPAKTYAYSGAALPSEPYDPADWTEVADTGFYSVVVANGYAQTLDFTGLAPTSLTISAISGRAVELGRGYVWSGSVDARHARNGNPLPQKVETRQLTYVDGGLVGTSSWVDITDTLLVVDPPADLGGGAQSCVIVLQVRTSYIGPACTVVTSPVFVCHPGLACP